MRQFVALGATWDADRVRAALRRLGVRIARRTGRKAYGDELSPGEREVASLAAEGHTNDDIASRLFVSVKTVEKHVSSALRKLEVNTRQDFGAALALGVGGDREKVGSVPP